MHINYHHAHHHLKDKTRKDHNRLAKLADDLVYVSAFVGIGANVPQLLKIWQDKNTAGVSIITWAGFLIGSVFWVVYGIIHKEKPIIVANFIFAIIQALIVIGLIMPQAASLSFNLIK